MNGAREKIDLGEITVHIRKFDAFAALHVLGELQKYFLTPIASALDVNNTTTEEEAIKAMTSAITELSKNVDGKTLIYIATLVIDPDLVSISVGGGEAFKATKENLQQKVDVFQLIQIIVSVVKVNFVKVFTEGLSRIGAALPSRMKKKFAEN